MDKRRAFYTIADEKYEEEYKRLEKSFKKYNPDAELIRFNGEDARETKDHMIFYRATPHFAKVMFDRGYDEIAKLDSDQIILGNLDHIWEGDYDVATVLNDPTYKIMTWDIEPYFNNGFVVIKSQAFAAHWLRLCHSIHFDRYQFKEQDLLNILASDYMQYKVRCLDLSDKAHGEFAKPFWTKAKVEKDKIMIEGKQLLVIHFGGGEGANKGNYKIKFQEDVVKFLDDLLK